MWVRRCGTLVAVRGHVPGIELDGTMTVHHRADRYLVNELNKPGAFRGHIVYRENIGKSGDELVVLYNELHPEDPISAWPGLADLHPGG